MKDLIERQAAIAYAISGRVRTLPTSEDGENWIRTEDVRQSLLTMPPADIDLSDYSDRLWRNAYEQGKADAEPRWISCERELPELASYVLVSHVGTVFVDCLTMENGDLLFWETGVFLAEEIRNLAWMPLPTPWKGEDDA